MVLIRSLSSSNRSIGMNRTSYLLLLALVFLSFGYTTRQQSDEISKIYLIGNTLIRTTPGKNIRFYDISSPANPRNVSTIAIEGNNDVAATGDYMYADRGTDLVIYDISNIASPRALDTIKRVFNRPYYGYWEGNDVVEVGGASGCGGCSDESPVAMSEPTRGNDAAERGGQGGSMARFVIVGDYLYCVDVSQLTVFDISDPARPRYKNAVDIGWQIETIFPSGTNLFIGGQSGMYIYDIHDAEEPKYVSEFTHVRSCDPVVVEGNLAYVTLRGGTVCGGYTNQLDIIDISDIKNPRLIRTVELSGPYGLTVRDGRVLVCDGSQGLKLIDATRPTPPVSILTDLTPYDVILRDNLLVVTAESGYYLYDASDLSQLRRFSAIP